MGSEARVGTIPNEAPFAKVSFWHSMSLMVLVLFWMLLRVVFAPPCLCFEHLRAKMARELQTFHFF